MVPVFLERACLVARPQEPVNGARRSNENFYVLLLLSDKVVCALQRH